MDSKILFDKIDNCFIKLRNSIRISGKNYVKNVFNCYNTGYAKRIIKIGTFQSRQVNDNETDSKAD